MSGVKTDRFGTAGDFFASLEQVVQPARIAGISGTVCFSIAGAGVWTVTISDGKSTVVPTENDAFDAKVSTDEASFLSIVNGAASARRLFMTGKVKVQGRLALAIKLDKLLGPDS